MAFTKSFPFFCYPRLNQARKTFFDDIRALTRYLYFPSWDARLSFMLRGLKIEVPDTN